MSVADAILIVLIVILAFCLLQRSHRYYANRCGCSEGAENGAGSASAMEESLAKARNDKMMTGRAENLQKARDDTMMTGRAENLQKAREDAYTTRGGSVVRGYSQVTSPEAYAAREMAERFGPGANDGFDPDSRDQVSARHTVTPPAWSDDALLFYGAVDAQTIQNHKEFTSENWLFNQNAAFADWGDAQNSPVPRTGIWGFLINNVPTSTNPHQVTSDQDDGGAQRNTYTDKRIAYGIVN